MTTPCIIEVAVNGVTQKARNPLAPDTPEEIAAQAIDSLAAGASIVHMHTLEQMMVFLPSLWTFATFVSVRWAVILGLVYVLGRAIYFVGYAKAANKRGIGFMIGALPTMALLLGGLVGAAMAALRQ